MDRLRQMAERHFGQTEISAKDAQDVAVQKVAENGLDRMSLRELLYFVLFDGGCSAMAGRSRGC